MTTPRKTQGVHTPTDPETALRQALTRVHVILCGIFEGLSMPSDEFTLHLLTEDEISHSGTLFKLGEGWWRIQDLNVLALIRISKSVGSMLARARALKRGHEEGVKGALCVVEGVLDDHHLRVQGAS